MPDDKTKVERVKETVRLLKELQLVGFHEVETGYKEIKRLMTQWVNDGESLSAVVPFPRHGREADVSLPKRADRAASINLRVVKPIE